MARASQLASKLKPEQVNEELDNNEPSELLSRLTELKSKKDKGLITRSETIEYKQLCKTYSEQNQKEFEELKETRSQKINKILDKK